MDELKFLYELRNKIREHNNRYYNLNKPTISDIEYDVLFAELCRLESLFPEYCSPASPINNIGYEAENRFKKIKHSHPMLSIGNCYSIEDIISFDKRMRDATGYKEIEYSVDCKYDGLALSLEYKNGLLSRALTRGDGVIGEDVTHNLHYIHNIPNTIELKTDIVIRGECVMLISEFNELNSRRAALGLKEFSNPRNLASGTLRILASVDDEFRRLHFFAYALLDADRYVDTYTQSIKFISKLGLPVFNSCNSCVGIDDLISQIKIIESKRYELPFLIDGVVVQVNDLHTHSLLGSTYRAPRYAQAYKLKPESSYTYIEAIDINIGRTGFITPVAKVKKTKVGGVHINSITLHNINDLLKKDIRLGDRVEICRSADVIPYILSVDYKCRSEDSKQFEIPSECVYCGSKIESYENSYFCSGHLVCPMQNRASIIHFASKYAMNISGLGESIIDLLLRKELISNIAGIYKLTISQIVDLDRMGLKSANNLISSINKSKKVYLSKFIYALGIKSVGRVASELLAQKYTSIDLLDSASLECLESIDTIGPKGANSIYTFFRSKVNKDLINSLLDSGVQLINNESVEDGELSGLRLIVTGSIDGLGRDEVNGYLKALGASIDTQIGLNTNFVIIGSLPGQSKLIKANKLGIECIDWNNFLKKFKLKS